MKKLIQLLLLLTISIGFSQKESQFIKKDIEKYHKNGYIFKAYDIFSSSEKKLDEELERSVKEASFFNLNKNVIHYSSTTLPH